MSWFKRADTPDPKPRPAYRPRPRPRAAGELTGAEYESLLRLVGTCAMTLDALPPTEAEAAHARFMREWFADGALDADLDEAFREVVK